MGYKRRFVVKFILSIFLPIVILCVIGITLLPKTIDYTDILFDLFQTQDRVLVSDVFQFEFDRAYVFDDCYISGEGFSKRYDLDLQIDSVEPGGSENFLRIIFVDKTGNLVYEFQYNSNQIFFEHTGLIIYPTTTITLISIQPNRLELLFGGEIGKYK